jgi:hypothetical protein
MKIQLRYLRLIVPALVILTAAGAFASRYKSSIQPAIVKTPVAAADTSNSIILQELSSVLHRMDTLTVVTIEGTITVRDMADSTMNMATNFCYSRNGNTAYYKMGMNEMVSLNDAYIFIAHDIKQIFLSPPKEVINPLQLPVSKEVDLLSKEGYLVSRREKDSLTKISLKNDIHPTCREYELSYDRTGWITESDMRIADESRPIDKNRDKFIRVAINSFQPGVVKTSLLRKDRYVSVANGVEKPASSLQGYELIKDR